MKPPPVSDPFNALVASVERSGGAQGPLSHKTFAVKGNIDVAGNVSDNGHPLWATTHPAATRDAPVVEALRNAGARLTGQTRMDEMAYSLLGDNPHYPPPINPAATERHTGGSSSGSAVAVAARLVDFAVGTDTAGSCRAPAAFCGVYGFRASHGVLSMQGVIPLAPSFDTIGWFARDIETMIAVGDALLPPDPAGRASVTLLRLADAFDGLDPRFFADSASLTARLNGIDAEAVRIGDETLDAALAHFRNLQAFEAWGSVGGWIKANTPTFGPGVAQRFAIAEKVTPEEKVAAEAFGRAFRTKIDALMGETGIIALPTAPFPAPRRDADPTELDAIRYRLMRFFIIASFCGLPQISVPIPTRGAPLGLSFIGRSGSDCALLDFTRRFLAGEQSARQ
jgi:amidase